MQWIIQQEGVEKCAVALATLLRVFERGLSVSHNKLEGPGTHPTFLHLPLQKLIELQELLHAWKGSRVCTRSKLKSLVGKLAGEKIYVTSGLSLG